jgi:hypothetical protein
MVVTTSTTKNYGWIRIVLRRVYIINIHIMNDYILCWRDGAARKVAGSASFICYTYFIIVLCDDEGLPARSRSLSVADTLNFFPELLGSSALASTTWSLVG